MKRILSIVVLLCLGHIAFSQSCDVAQDGVKIYNADNTAMVSTIARGHNAQFRFTIKNVGIAMNCEIPANTITAVFDFPTLTGNIKPYKYVGPSTFTSGYFTWTYNSVDDVLEGINSSAIPGGNGDAVSVQVKGNEAGIGNSNLNITQRQGISDNVGNNFSGARLVVAAGSRAADISTFTATTEKCNVGLNWKTTSEFNLSHFEIEYSVDGIAFTKVGRIEGNDLASGANYQFTYTQTKAEGHYRLKAVARNGDYEYSDMVDVNADCNKTRKISFFPNPVNFDQQLVVNISGHVGKIIGELYNGIGQRVASYSLANKANELTVSNLAAGSYTLKVKDESGVVESLKVVITR